MSGYSYGGIPLLTGQVQAQLTGTTTPPGTIFIWKLFAGSIVSILVDANGLSTSDSTELQVPAGTFPTFLRPVGNTRVLSCPLVDNNFRKLGRADIPSSGGGLAGGIIFVLPNADGVLGETNFTATGLKGIPVGTELIYTL